jgi:hypothetical protein
MGVWRSASLGLALAALTALASPVSAGAVSNASDEQVHATGSIVYTWHGDPARGCAQAGVCGVRGALVFQPDGDGDVFRFGSFGSLLGFAGETATVRVQGGDLGAGGECVDQTEGDASGMSLNLSPGGAVSGEFPPGALSSGHCAGPLSQDLARLLIRGHRSHARQPTFDLRGSMPLTAGPFSGELESTLVLHPEPSAGSSGGSSFSSGGPGSPPSSKVLLEEVDLRYRVSLPSGTLGLSFAGGPGAFCAALDSCGAHGSLSFAFPRLTGEVQISAARVVKRRVSRAQALRDLRAGKLHVFGGAPLSWVAPQLSETFTDGGTCTDSVPAPELGLEFGPLTGTAPRNLQVAVVNLDSRDPLRTHCPGPEAADALEGNGALATARIPHRRLLEHRWTFSLREQGGFGSPGYVGVRHGRLGVTMSLLKVIAGTRREEG